MFRPPTTDTCVHSKSIDIELSIEPCWERSSLYALTTYYCTNRNPNTLYCYEYILRRAILNVSFLAFCLLVYLWYLDDAAAVLLFVPVPVCGTGVLGS